MSHEPGKRVHEYITGHELDSKELRDIHMALIAGTIGSGATLEFIAFSKLFSKLPNFASIMANPESVEFDNSPDVVFALTGLLAQHASPTNIEKVLKFVDRLSGDFQALVVKNMRQRNTKLTHAQPITDWMTTNAERFIE